MNQSRYHGIVNTLRLLRERGLIRLESERKTVKFLDALVILNTGQGTLSVNFTRSMEAMLSSYNKVEQNVLIKPLVFWMASSIRRSLFVDHIGQLLAFVFKLQETQNYFDFFDNHLRFGNEPVSNLITLMAKTWFRVEFFYEYFAIRVSRDMSSSKSLIEFYKPDPGNAIYIEYNGIKTESPRYVGVFNMYLSKYASEMFEKVSEYIPRYEFRFNKFDTLNIAIRMKADQYVDYILTKNSHIDISTFAKNNLQDSYSKEISATISRHVKAKKNLMLSLLAKNQIETLRNIFEVNDGWVKKRTFKSLEKTSRNRIYSAHVDVRYRKNKNRFTNSNRRLPQTVFENIISFI